MDGPIVGSDLGKFNTVCSCCDKSTRRATFHGQVLLLVFSATWSKTLGWAEMLPEMQLAHKLYADRRLVVIGIQHHGERLENVEALISKAGLTFPIAIDHAEDETFECYRGNCYPSAF